MSRRSEPRQCTIGTDGVLERWLGGHVLGLTHKLSGEHRRAVLENTVGCPAGVCPLERRVTTLDQQGTNTSPFDVAVKGSPPRQAQRCNWIAPRRLHLLDDRIASCFRESRRTVLPKCDR